ncbi:hypothetical protein N6B72_18545 [Chryseobacterium soli]|uniref:Uncharacterized protein n=1 Tax=Chryseobacterium soli TaxID=445961 RepID=A0A086A5A4_9FLAO|nr:hypothetical protein [Chryseobacterium soli]KFF11868.1 hypothetical protein IW15_14380 [Chryseobacterium soli]MDV7698932.1 hypothetical protein [Chryseobacterium soli]
MKKIAFFTFLICGVFTFSQVGINTSTPSASLDIASKGNTSATKALEVNNSSALEMVTVLDNGNVGIGIANPTAQLHTTGTVRMDGLGTNVTNTKVMTTDPAGNVTTRLTNTLLPQIMAGGNGTDAVPTTQTISSINNTPGYTNNLASKSFTISQTSLVTFSYSLGVLDILTSSGSNNFNDGAAKQIGANLIWKSLPAGSSFAINGILCTNAMPISNTNNNYASGTFYQSNSCSIILIPGTYAIELQGFLNAFDNIQGIRATFGGSPYDRLDISATSVQ